MNEETPPPRRPEKFPVIVEFNKTAPPEIPPPSPSVELPEIVLFVAKTGTLVKIPPPLEPPIEVLFEIVLLRTSN